MNGRVLGLLLGVAMVGGSAEAVFVVQAGIHNEDDLIKAVVVDGMVVAYEGTCLHPNGFAGCAATGSVRPRR